MDKHIKTVAGYKIDKKLKKIIKTILHVFFCYDPEQKEPCLKYPGSEWTNLQIQFNLHSYKIHNGIYKSLNPHSNQKISSLFYCIEKF